MPNSCAVVGACPTDYIAVIIAILSFSLLLWRAVFPFVVHKVPRVNGSGFWIPVVQVFASFNFLLSLMMSVNLLKFKRRHWWQSCYIWAVWFEGPLGFGLLMSCRIAQTFQLYFIFVKRRLPPIRSYIFLPLILLPWVTFSALIHAKKPLNYRCHASTEWIILFACFHSFYIAVLVGLAGAIRHIEFKFDELKDLVKAILVSASSVGLWVAAYVMNEVHDEISWLQVVSRFLLLVTASILVLAFFSISSSEPLLSQISLRKKEPLPFETMGQALGIPDSGLLSQRNLASPVDPNEPLDKLLLNKRFRKSFLAFADSCLAGESVHFYNEVRELDKIPADDSVKRIYMARHIIDKYIVSGAEMEVNISHRSRQEILNTTNLADTNLFKNALNELMQLMKTNLAKDYWSSMFFIKFKEEASRTTDCRDPDHTTGWSFSPRPSSIRDGDDPFHQEQVSRGSDCSDQDLEDK